LAVTYRAFIKIACIMIHLRHRRQNNIGDDLNIQMV
jgi:hypothetical protein